jgi:AcrR family transcriptional regulator
MARPRDKRPVRIEQLISSGIKLFARNGYNKTLMSDIARDMGISPGTLYFYVDSKKALFNFLLRYIFLEQKDLDNISLPIKISRGISLRSLLEKIEGERPTFQFVQEAIANKNITDVNSEFENILRELYRSFVRYRYAVVIIMQSARDYPELAEFLYKYLRDHMIKLLSEYMTIRISQGLLRPVPDTSIAARLIYESSFWFAVHRHGGLYPTKLNEKIAEDAVVDALKSAFIIRT